MTKPDHWESVRLICNGACLGAGDLAELILLHDNPRTALADALEAKAVRYVENNPNDLDVSGMRAVATALRSLSGVP